MKHYQCPNCKRIWNEFDLAYSEGNCLTELEICGWEDELNEIYYYQKLITICTYEPEYAPQTFSYHYEHTGRELLNEILGRCWWSILDRWCFETLNKAGVELKIIHCFPWQNETGRA